MHLSRFSDKSGTQKSLLPGTRVVLYWQKKWESVFGLICISIIMPPNAINFLEENMHQTCVEKALPQLTQP